MNTQHNNTTSDVPQVNNQHHQNENTGNYTQDREAWQTTYTIDDIFNDLNR